MFCRRAGEGMIDDRLSSVGTFRKSWASAPAGRASSDRGLAPAAVTSAGAHTPAAGGDVTRVPSITVPGTVA
jgi:hypothetical protein